MKHPLNHWVLHLKFETKLLDAPKVFSELIPSKILLKDAFQLSVSVNHPIYDCFYLALAKKEDAPLVTADKRLAIMTDRIGVACKLLRPDM